MGRRRVFQDLHVTVTCVLCTQQKFTCKSLSSALSNNSSDTITHSAPAAAIAAAASLPWNDPIPKPTTTLRGLNKPKCIVCGNVARSRCPYQSCKNCCAQAQNPCHIHVLKGNATHPDKTPAASTPVFDQQTTEVSPAVSSFRAASLRQLSSNFSQFNSLHTPLCSRKPLTRKEAAAINEWRFCKLKEFKDRDIEVENEAFDRYMQNISLLEEVFSTKSILEGFTKNGSISSNPDDPSAVNDSEKMISGQKLKLRSNPIRTENVRKRIQQIIDGRLSKFQKAELTDTVDDLDKHDGMPEKASGVQAERASALSELIDKLNRAGTDEDLKSCIELKAQLDGQHSSSNQMETEVVDSSEEQTAKSDLAPSKKLDYCSQKIYRTVGIDQEALRGIDAHFSSLEKIEDL